MKGSIPDNAKIAKDAKECVQVSAGLFYHCGKGKDQDTAKKANFKDWAVFVIWKPAKYKAAVTPPLTLPLTYS